MYKEAAQRALRFPSNRGPLTVENLFDLPLKDEVTNFDLDTVARTLSNALKARTQESFVKIEKADDKTKDLELSLEIVKDVILTKQAEDAAALAKIQITEQRKVILDAIKAKKIANIQSLDIDALEKELEALKV